MAKSSPSVRKKAPVRTTGGAFSVPLIRQEVLDDVPAPGLEARPITVYLPGGRVSPAGAPLLLALDGQTMPQWELVAALQDLAAEDGAGVPVVAAIPASPERVEEYGMAGGLDFAGRGVLAAQFRNYLVHGVLPVLRRRYGVGVERERTGIFGASLGGLCAFDTAWRHSRDFGCVGVFSGSLWWRADNTDAAAQQASRLAHRLVRATKRLPSLRLWFEAGTADETADRDGNGVIDAIQDTTELIELLEARGLVRGSDLVYREVEGGEHNEATWGRVLPEFLRWTWPKEKR